MKTMITLAAVATLLITTPDVTAQDRDAERAPPAAEREAPARDGDAAERTAPQREGAERTAPQRGSDEAATRTGRDPAGQQTRGGGQWTEAKVIERMAQENSKHREHMAKLDRLRDLAQKSGDTRRLGQIDELAAKETARHRSMMDKGRRAVGDEHFDAAQRKLGEMDVAGRAAGARNRKANADDKQPERSGEAGRQAPPARDGDNRGRDAAPERGGRDGGGAASGGQAAPRAGAMGGAMGRAPGRDGAGAMGDGGRDRDG